MALRFGISALIVAILIGITALVSNNKKDDNPSATTSSSAATTSTTALPATLPAGCVDTAPAANPNRPTSFKSAPPMTIDTAKTYTAKLSTSCGDITVALDAKNASTSVNNFVFLAKQGFYDGLKWPRAAGGFVIQTGSPTDDQQGGPGYSVKTEVPAQAGYAAGSVAWAKGGSEPAGTAGSQFFVVTGDGGSTLPADYGTIGTVSAGLDNAQKIASLAPDGGTGDGPPTIPMYLLKVEITES